MATEENNDELLPYVSAEDQQLMRRTGITFPTDPRNMELPTLGKFRTRDYYIEKKYGEKLTVPSFNDVKELVKNKLYADAKYDILDRTFRRDPFDDVTLDRLTRAEYPRVLQFHEQRNAERIGEYTVYAKDFLHQWLVTEEQLKKKADAEAAKQEGLFQKNGALGRLVAGTAVDWNAEREDKVKKAAVFSEKLQKIDEFRPIPAARSVQQIAADLQAQDAKNNPNPDERMSPRRLNEVAQERYVAEKKTYDEAIAKRAEDYKTYSASYDARAKAAETAYQAQIIQSRHPDLMHGLSIAGTAAIATYGVYKGTKTARAAVSASTELQQTAANAAANATAALPALFDQTARAATAVAAAQAPAVTAGPSLGSRLMAMVGRNRTPEAAPVSIANPAVSGTVSTTPGATATNDPAKFLTAAGQLESSINGLKELASSKSFSMAAGQNARDFAFGCALGDVAGITAVGIDAGGATPERMQTMRGGTYWADLGIREGLLCIANGAIYKTALVAPAIKMGPHGLNSIATNLDAQHGHILKAARDKTPDAIAADVAAAVTAKGGANGLRGVEQALDDLRRATVGAKDAAADARGAAQLVGDEVGKTYRAVGMAQQAGFDARQSAAMASNAADAAKQAVQGAAVRNGTTLAPGATPQGAAAPGAAATPPRP